jgi:hypothetical protein
MTREYTVEKSSGGYYFITLDARSAKKLMQDGNKRVVCIINSSVTLHCAILGKLEDGFYLRLSHATFKKLGLKTGSTIRVELNADDSEYQFAMVEELREVLSTDPEASEIFHSFTPGKQRSLIYLISAVKSSDKRIERALKVAERIKMGVTSPNLILK